MGAFFINSRWIALAPARRFDVTYWSTVQAMLIATGCKPEKATDEEVIIAMEFVAEDAIETAKAARVLRDQAKQLEEQARELERGIPVGVLA